MVQASVFKISYGTETGELLLNVFGRDTEGKRVAAKLSGTEPYFFALEAEQDRLAPFLGSKVVKITPGFRGVAGQPMVRVQTRFPFQVPEVRDVLSYHGEADVIFSLRERGEHGLNHVEIPATNGQPIPVSRVKSLTVPPAVKPRVLDFDIEVEDRRGFARPEDPTAPVLSVAFYDNYRLDRLGIVYQGPPADSEAVKAEMNRHLPADAKFTGTVSLFLRKTETELLASFGSVLMNVDPDIVTAYNGSKYDFPYVGGRALRILEGLSAPNPHLVHLADTFDEKRSRNSGRHVLADPLAIYKKKELKAKQFSLESVATDLLGYGKVPRDGTVGDLKRSNLIRFLAYNAIDTLLLYRVREKERLLQYALRIAFETNTEIPDIYYASRGVDGHLFQTARETGKVEVVLPSKDFAPKFMRRGSGATVFESQVGLFQGVVELDFSEEYPNLMRTFNIDPTTRIPARGPEPGYRLPTGGKYRKEPKGIVYRSLERIGKQRTAAKQEAKKHALGTPERKDADTISDAIKAQVNSFAGVIGSSDWRLGTVVVFEDITGMARLHLALKKRLLEDPEWMSRVLGFRSVGRVLYGDTDSCYALFFDGDQQITDLDRLHSEIVPKIYAALTAEYDAWTTSFGAERNFVRDSAKGIYEVFRLLPLASGDGETGAKKRYYGLLAFDGDTDVRSLSFDRRIVFKGIEVKRRNTAKLTRDAQKHLMELSLTLHPPRDAVDYVDSLRDRLRAGELDEDLPIACQLSKDRHAYKVAGDFVRAMDRFRDLTGRGILPGDEFKWFFVRGGVEYDKNPGVGSGFESLAIPYSWTVAEAHERGFQFDIDHEAMFEKVVRAPARLVVPEIAGGTPSLDEEW